MKKLICILVALLNISYCFSNSYKTINLKYHSYKFNNNINIFMNKNKAQKAKKENLSNKGIFATINYYSKLYNINPQIILGLAIKESNLTQAPKDSTASCRGICQISKFALDSFNAYWWARNSGSYNQKLKAMYTWKEMYEYNKNIEVACWYLYWLQKYK